MTAQAAARSIVERESLYSSVPMKGATTIYQGALVVMDAGFAIPGKTGTGLVVVGIADATVKNDGANGAMSILVRRTTCRFVNDTVAPVQAGDIGKPCFIVDDQTVSKSNGGDPVTRSEAGIVIDVDAAGVFVRIGQ